MLQILLLQLTSVFAGHKTLDSASWLSWNDVKSDSTAITFVLGISTTIYSDNTWAGIGLKSASSSQDMVGAEIVSFMLGSESGCQNRYALKNAYPPVDTVSDITCINRTLSSGYYLYSWSRPLTSSSTNGFSLTGLNKIMVIWARGPVVNNDISYHGDTAGTSTIYLKGDSFSKNLIFSLVLGLFSLF